LHKLAVMLTKGGTGKTTTAVNLGHGLALAGLRVLLIDADTSGAAGRALGVRAARSWAEIVSGSARAADVLTEARPGLWLAPGGQSLASVKREIARRDMASERVLAEALAPLGDRFDVAILDAAPGWDSLTVNVLFYADDVLAPCALEVLAVYGLADFVQRIETVRRYRPGLGLRYVLPTFYDRRVAKSEELRAQLAARFGAVLLAPIRYNVRLSEAAGFGQSIFEYAPKSTGAADYAALAERIGGDYAAHANA